MDGMSPSGGVVRTPEELESRILPKHISDGRVAPAFYYGSLKTGTLTSHLVATLYSALGPSTGIYVTVTRLFLLAAIGWQHELGWPWFAALTVASLLFGQQMASVRTRDRDACFKAFLANNWVGAAVFLGALGHFILAGVYSSD